MSKFDEWESQSLFPKNGLFKAYVNTQHMEIHQQNKIAINGNGNIDEELEYRCKNRWSKKCTILVHASTRDDLLHFLVRQKGLHTCGFKPMYNYSGKSKAINKKHGYKHGTSRTYNTRSIMRKKEQEAVHCSGFQFEELADKEGGDTSVSNAKHIPQVLHLDRKTRERELNNLVKAELNLELNILYDELIEKCFIYTGKQSFYNSHLTTLLINIQQLDENTLIAYMDFKLDGNSELLWKILDWQQFKWAIRGICDKAFFHTEKTATPRYGIPEVREPDDEGSSNEKLNSDQQQQIFSLSNETKFEELHRIASNFGLYFFRDRTKRDYFLVDYNEKRVLSFVESDETFMFKETGTELQYCWMKVNWEQFLWAMRGKFAFMHKRYA